MKAGVHSICITPDRPIRMAGFADRANPPEGKYQDLFVKALALEDAKGKRAVIVTADILGYNAAISDLVLRQAQERFALQPDEVLLNASHTHCGPVVSEPDYSQKL